MQSIQTGARVRSVDIFRGLTILVMVFVNDLAGVKGLPWWTYHIPPGEQGITYVDVVFPAFLFIVGMVIPVALRRRLDRGDTPLQLGLHVLIRSLTLVLIGLLIMNGRAMDPGATGISYALWNVLMFVGVILFWNVYPASGGPRDRLYKLLKGTGLLLLVVLLVLYRRNDEGVIRWIDPENWAILGGIGWAYLSGCILFFLLRGRFWALLGAFVLLIALNVAVKADVLQFLSGWPRYLWPFGTGSLASITMAGILFSRIFLDHDLAETYRQKLAWGAALVLLFMAGGWGLLPFGLAKIGGTPSWCLLSAGFSAIIYLAVYWIADVRGHTRWAGFFKPAGSNPLLTYLLPDIYYAAVGLHHFAGIADQGWPGVLRSLLFSLFILGISALLTRWRIRLQL